MKMAALPSVVAGTALTVAAFVVGGAPTASRRTPGRTCHWLRCNSRQVRQLPPYKAEPKVCSTTNYFEPGPVSGIQMSSWCVTCHTRYLASSSASSGDAIFANRHVRARCIKCHAAHGTNAGASGMYSSTVGYPGGGIGTTSTAESRLLKMDNRGICVKCHTEY